MASKILRFKEIGYYFQQTHNRDVANFLHGGAVLATDMDFPNGHLLAYFV